jgi:hypothetical protein
MIAIPMSVTLSFWSWMRHATTSMPTNVELGFAMTKVFFCTVHEQ